MEEEFSWSSLILRYFFHGFLFSVLLTLSMFVWIAILIMLWAIGSFLGLLIGFFVLFFIVGGLNAFLAGLIWSISVKSKWTSLLGHGLVLFIILAIVQIPSFVVSFIFPGIATSVILFFIYSLVDGFVAKSVAGWWEEEEYAETSAR